MPNMDPGLRREDENRRIPVNEPYETEHYIAPSNHNRNKLAGFVIAIGNRTPLIRPTSVGRKSAAPSAANCRLRIGLCPTKNPFLIARS